MSRDTPDATDRRLTQLELGQQRLARDVEQLRQELAAFGIEIPELNPGERPRLSPQARVSAGRLRAALARAAKAVGEGKGAVRDEATMLRMKAEFERLGGELDRVMEDEE